jgi:hypothetical protein
METKLSPSTSKSTSPSLSSSPLPTTTPTTDPGTDGFTLFPKLPPELRLKIWKFAAQRPRIIKIQFLRATQPNDGNVHTQESYGVVSITAGFPAMLRANRESREVVGKEYLLARLSFPSTIPTPPNMQLVFYINFERDCVYAVGVEVLEGLAFGMVAHTDKRMFHIRPIASMVCNLMVSGEKLLHRGRSCIQKFRRLDTLVMEHQETTRFVSAGELTDDREYVRRLEEERTVSSIEEALDKGGKKIPESRFLNKEEMEVMWMKSMGR